MNKHLMLLFGLVLVVSVVPCESASAWGDEGHELVANIAYPMLTATAKAKVDALLAADTDALTAKDFASRATWADKYRDAGDRKLHYEQTQHWHFVDTEISVGDLNAACFSFPALGTGVLASNGVAPDCAANKIIEFQAELADPGTSDAERLLALKFLLHFVGDIHQPLHASDDNDFGGNCEQVRLSKAGAKQALHHYWDVPAVESIITADQTTHAGASLADVAIRLRESISASNLNSWKSTDPKAWALETFQVSKTTAYKLPAHAQCTTGETAAQYPAFVLPKSYQVRAVATAKSQIQKAGVRLAVTLNEALK
jgi:hypothetical protein